MSRVSIDLFYMKMAYLISERATCVRRKVGSVIVKDKIVLSTGYNGVPTGLPHCTDEMCIRKKLNIPSGEQHEKCITGDKVIKLLDGTYKTIKELAEIGKDFWVYSIDIKTGKIVPGLATNPHLTGYRNDIVEITFDNGKTLKCTSDHKILLRNCEYKEAKDLQYGDSCMPIYYTRGKDNNKHEVVQNIKKGSKSIKWENDWKCNTHSTKTHEIVYRNINNFNGQLGKNTKDVYHKDGNKFNNVPNNLELLSKSEHMKIHGGFANWDKKDLNAISKKGTDTIGEMVKNDEEFRKKGKILRGLSYLLFKCNENNEELNLNNYKDLSLKYAPKYKLGEKGSMPPKIEKVLNFYNSLEDALEEAKVYNHKVIKVKILKDIDVPVYDVSVLKYENFAVDLGDNSCVVISNCRGAHSEMNAISQAAKNGIDINNSTIYCTTQPCIYCAKAIVNSGIKRLVYCESYGNGMDELTKEMLQNIQVDIIPKEDIFE